MIDNTILNNFHNKAFIIYTNEDWCGFLLKINPYLYRPFHSELLDSFSQYSKPLYLRMYVDPKDNALQIDGWDLLTNFKQYNDPAKITQVDCMQGFPNWFLKL